MTPKNQRKTKKIQDAYNETAEFYNTRYEHIQFLKFSLILPKLWIGTTRINLQGPLLDCGGGSGLLIKFFSMLREFIENSSTNTEIIQEKFNPEQIFLFKRLSQLIQKRNKGKNYEFSIPALVICDLSLKMLMQCKKMIKNMSNPMIKEKFLGTIACNGEFLPFRDAIFHTITAFTVIQNFNNMERGIKEIGRISQEKARIGISILKKGILNKKEFVNMMSSYFKEINSVLIDKEMINTFKSLKKNLENKQGIYIDNSSIENIKNIEDYLFFILK